MSHFDPELKDALDRRSEGVRVVADLAERAIARDRSNRRRELGAAVLGAGLVLAVALPVAVASMNRDQGRTIPAGPTVSSTVPSEAPTGAPAPSRTASATPTSIPTVTADGGPARANLRPATGGPTGTTTVPYYVDGVIHDGSRQIRVEHRGQGGTISRLAGGRWVLNGEQTLTTLVVDATGATVEQLPGTPTVADDGTLFVTEERGTLRAYDPAGALLRTLAATTCDCTPPGTTPADSPGYDVVGIIGSVVYANRGFTGQSVAWDVSTSTRRSLEGSLVLVSSARGTALVAPEEKSGATHPCHELRDLTSGRTLWRLCGPLVARSFSADGDHLLMTGRIDGLDKSQLDSDGKSFRYGGLVVVRTSDAAIVLEGGTDVGGDGSPVTYRMGDDDSITAQIGSTTGERSLQRCTLDGACEVVAPGRARDLPDIPEGDDPYFLSTN